MCTTNDKAARMSVKRDIELYEKSCKRVKGLEHDTAELRISEVHWQSQPQRLPTWWESLVPVDVKQQLQRCESPPKRTSSQTDGPTVSLQTWAHAVQNSISLAARSDDADTEDTATSSCSSGSTQHGNLHVQSAADDEGDSMQVRFSFGIRPCLTPDLSAFEVIDQDIIDSLLSLAQS